MKTTLNPQLGLLDSLMPATPANDFLERLDHALDWGPIEAALQALYPATTGRPPHAPLVLFQRRLLQHCYGLSAPQCEEQVRDRLSWRRFLGLGLQDAVPDETTLVRFRQRLRAHGLPAHLLALVNQQLEPRGLLLKTCTLVEATLLRQATLTSARVQDGCEFLNLVHGDEQTVVADKAYWSGKHVDWCAAHGVTNGLLRKAQRGEKPSRAVQRANRCWGAIRRRVETVFGWWKRSAHYRRVRYVGWAANRLELEFKCISWNLKRLVHLQPA